MGDGNESLGALGNRLALEVDYSIFGSDVHHVGTWRGDDVALCQVQDDPATAVAPSFVSGGQADERLAPIRSIRTAYELQLPARATDMAVTVGFRGGLALQVDLGCVVDRDEIGRASCRERVSIS